MDKMDMSHHHHHHNMSDMHSMHNMSGMHNMHNMTNMDNMHNMHNMHDMNGMKGMHGMDGMDGMHMNMSGMDMMKMYFHTGLKEYILFEELHTKSEKHMIGACFAIFFIAVLYEGLKFFREVLLQRSLQDKSSQYFAHDKMSAGASQEHMVGKGQSVSVTSQMFSVHHAVQTFLHIIQIFVSYCLMLVFMTYNVWLCLAVVLGAGFGYFFFGWKRAVVVDATEHCH